MLYRPLLLLLLLSLLHSSFIAKHLTMNSLPMYSNDGIYSSFFSSSSSPSSRLVLSISSMYAFYSLVHRSDGYLKGKRKRILLTILSILISTCRCGDVGNHLRSSPFFYILSFPFKGGGNAFFCSLSSCLCSVSSSFLFLSRLFALLN